MGNSKIRPAKAGGGRLGEYSRLMVGRGGEAVRVKGEALREKP